MRQRGATNLDQIIPQGYPLWVAVSKPDDPEPWTGTLQVIGWIYSPGKRLVPLTPNGPLPPSGTGGYNWQLVDSKEEGLGVGLADIIKPHLDVGDD
jgi:hypothetical protein